MEEEKYGRMKKKEDGEGLRRMWKMEDEEWILVPNLTISEQKYQKSVNFGNFGRL